MSRRAALALVLWPFVGSFETFYDYIAKRYHLASEVIIDINRIWSSRKRVLKVLVRAQLPDNEEDKKETKQYKLFVFREMMQ
jgi:hypothetical protein